MKPIRSLLLQLFFTVTLAILTISSLPAQDAAPKVNSAAVPTPKKSWIDEAKALAEQGKAINPALVFDGDSITAGWRGQGLKVWNERYAKFKAFSFGIPGDQVQHVLWRVVNGQVDGLNPKLVVLMIGTNNGGNSPEEIAEGIQVLIGEYQKRCPSAHILLLGVFPRGEQPNTPARAKIIKINELISKFANDKVTFLDIGTKFLTADGTLTKEVMPDALHPGLKGYEIWADAIQAEIDKYFPPTK